MIKLHFPLVIFFHHRSNANLLIIIDCVRFWKLTLKLASFFKNSAQNAGGSQHLQYDQNKNGWIFLMCVIGVLQCQDKGRGLAITGDVTTTPGPGSLLRHRPRPLLH